MALPLHEPAAPGTATCRATTGILSSDAVRALGAFHFNLIRQGCVTVLLAVIVVGGGHVTQIGAGGVAIPALSGVVGILPGDSLNFAAVGRLGPRRAGAIFALNAPMAAALSFVMLGERLGLQAGLAIGVTVASGRMLIFRPFCRCRARSGLSALVTCGVIAPVPTLWPREITTG